MGSRPFTFLFLVKMTLVVTVPQLQALLVLATTAS